MALRFLAFIIGISLVFSKHTQESFLDKVVDNLFQCPEPPFSCPNVNVTFYLYNRNALPFKGYILNESNPETIQKAPFIVGAPVVLSVHGFDSHLTDAPNPQLIKAFNISNQPVNIIALSYYKLVPMPCYAAAIRNVPLIGNCTARFLQIMLRQMNWFSLKDIHFIGHSMGAQVLSQISRFLRKIGEDKPNRMSALDAALPGYYPSETPKKLRLDKSDCYFLDAYHTNVGEWGQLIRIGHVDCYANFYVTQPGCQFWDVFCNHEKSVLYFAESYYTDKGFWGYLCPSARTPVGNICKEPPHGPLLLGAYVNQSQEGFYCFNTHSKPPYAMGKCIDGSEPAKH